MTLSFDGFCITGTPQEIAEFLKNYKDNRIWLPLDKTFWIHSNLPKELRDFNEYLDHCANDIFDAKRFTDRTLIDLLATKHLDKDYDLETLTREELIDLANRYCR